MKPVLCIAGPTASGKSRFAIDLAKAVDGEIINADALQVYRQLQILSARPSQNEMAQIPHHMFGHIDGAVRYSVGHWLREVEPVILECLARGKTPILTGGTGLYFKALTRGLADIPPISREVEACVQALLDTQGIGALRKRCESIDPQASAAILGDDPHRLMRVLGVYEQSGTPLSQWRRQTRPRIPPRFTKCAVLMPERAHLYDVINARYAAMVENGGMDEARAVLDAGLADGLPMMKAIGLSPLLDYLRGARELGEALSQAQQDTRRFAKRQMTWFRNQTPDWPKLVTHGDRAQFIAQVKASCA